MNQTFKQKMMVVSIAAALTAGVVGTAAANSFEASLLGTYPTASKITLKTGTSTPKVLVGPKVVGDGTAWPSSTAAAYGVRFVLPAGIDIFGALASSSKAGATISGSATNVSSTLVAGTSVDLYATAADGVAGYVVTKPATGSSYALFGYGTNMVPVGLDATSMTSITGRKTDNSLAGSSVKLRAFAGDVVGATDTAGVKVGTITKNSDGTTTIALAVAGTGTVTTDVMVMPDLIVGAQSSAAAGSFSVQVKDGLADGGQGLGLTTPISQAVGTVTTNLVAISSAATTYPSVGIGTVAAQTGNDFTLTFADSATVPTGGSTITLALSGGAKFKAGSLRTPALTNTGGTSGLVGTAVLNSDGTLSIPVTAGSVATGATIAISSGAYIDGSSVTAGDINVTATSTLSGFGSNTVKVATAAAKGVALDVAPTGSALPTVYTGRTSVTLGSVITGVTVTESAVGSLLQSGDFVITPSSGAKIQSGITVADSGTGTNSLNLTNFTAVGGTSVASTVSNSSVSAPGVLTLTGLSFDLTSATAGDLNLAFSGNSGVSGSLKVATIKDATAASVGGTVPAAVSGAVVALPDVVITEAAAGAINANGTNLIGFAAPTTQVASFDLTGASIKVFAADGTDVTSTIVGTNKLTAAVSPVSDTAGFTLAPVAKSTTTTAGGVGPVTYKISGVKATLANNASGTVNLTVAGANSAALGLNVAAGSAGALSSNDGAQLTKQSVKVAQVVSATTAVYPTVTVADQTKATIANVPLTVSGNDQGRPGAVYVAVIFDGVVVFMDSNSNWVAYDPAKSPVAVYSGSLSTVNLDIFKSQVDLTPYKGAQLIIGYGTGVAPLNDPFKTMLNNVNYNVIYTVK